MDAITQYRQQIQNLLTAHASLVWDDRIKKVGGNPVLLGRLYIKL